MQAAPPCVIPAANTCAQIFPQREVCEDQSGVWYGPGSDADPAGLPSCCAVNSWLESRGQSPTSVFPLHQAALRDSHYKLVRLNRMDCATNTFANTEEFYEINESADPAQLLLDRAGLNLLADKTPAELTAAQQASFNQLSHDLTALLNSQSECPGDGNGDWRVDDDDLAEWAYWADPARGGGLSSWYDLNHDGLTNEADREIILAHSGSLCQP